MFKHILVPVDGSSTSAQAVQKAAALAKVFASQVSTVFVIDPYPFTGVGTEFAYGQTEYLEAANAEAKQAIATAHRQPGRGGREEQGGNPGVAHAVARHRGVMRSSRVRT